MKGKKNEILQAIATMEYYPAVFDEQNKIEKYQKVPFERISTFGVAFEPLKIAFHQIVNGADGGTGLYHVSVPKGTHLAKFNDGRGFLGAALKANGSVGGGQAVLTPVALNPTMLFMAVVLSGIESKLGSIIEIQEEIIDFLKQKEKAELRGNLNFLIDVINNYKFNWTNEKYKDSNLKEVLSIKRDSEQKIVFYKTRIEDKLRKKKFIHVNKNVDDKMKKIQEDFKEYQLALYLFSFTSFLEILLLENFNKEFLNATVNKIREYALNYREVYTKSYEYIESDAKKSIEGRLMSGIATINKTAGDAIAKVPVINKSPIDEALIETGSKISKFYSKKTKETMEKLSTSNNSNVVMPFIENIETIDKLHNQPVELLFDRENIYFNFV